MELAILEGNGTSMQNLYSAYSKLSEGEKAELLGFSIGKSLRRLSSAAKPTNIVKFAARQTQKVNPLHYIPGTRGSFLDPSAARVAKQFHFGSRMVRKTGNLASQVAPVAKYIPVVGTAVMAIDDANKARKSFGGGLANISSLLPSGSSVSNIVDVQNSLFEKIKDSAPDVAEMVANADIQQTAQNILQNNSAPKSAFSNMFARLRAQRQLQPMPAPPGFVEDAEGAVQKVIDKINLPAVKTETSLNFSNFKTPLLIGGGLFAAYMILKKK